MKRFALPLLAAGLVGAVLPLSTATTAHADESPAYSGFSSTTWAAPVKIEIYEPTIPIPSSPQLEFEFAYSRVIADSTSSRARASWMWPGDPVGEGAKTIIEQLGLPPELSGPLAAQGYPVQVNSTYPSGPKTQTDEPFPGTVMRTTSGAKKTTAETGFSPDGEVQDSEGAGGGGHGGGGGGGGLPGLPGLPIPGLPALPGLSLSGGDVLTQLGQALTGQSAGSSSTQKNPADQPAPSPAPGVPPELAALVDFGGYISTSKNVNTGRKVTSTSRAAVGDVSLIGGLVTMSGVTAKSTASSNGKVAKPAGKAHYGTLSIAGQEFAIGPEGIEAAGSPAPIPGLPDNPLAALEQLGITITFPKPVFERDGDKATSTVAGLVLDIDTNVLRRKLDAIPFDDILGALPAEAAELTSLLQTVVGLAPRFVITLGVASSTVDTVQGIAPPPPPGPEPDPDGGDSNGDNNGDNNGGTTGGTTGGSTGSPTSGTPATSTDAGGDTGAVGNLPATEPLGAGLPPLFSIPGVLLFGGIALATMLGSYFRKLGLAALGGGAACSHGLDSGLPDLRKA